MKKKLPNHKLDLLEDNEATLSVLNSGRNPAMRHLGKTHAISVAWLHERFMAGDICLCKRDTKFMAAHIFTKSFFEEPKW